MLHASPMARIAAHKLERGFIPLAYASHLSRRWHLASPYYELPARARTHCAPPAHFEHLLRYMHLTSTCAPQDRGTSCHRNAWRQAPLARWTAARGGGDVTQRTECSSALVASAAAPLGAVTSLQRSAVSPWLSLEAPYCVVRHPRPGPFYSTDARLDEMAGAPSSTALPLSVQPYTWLLVTTISTTLSWWSVGMLSSSCTSYDRATAGGAERAWKALGAWWES